MIIQKPDGKCVVDYGDINFLEEKYHLTPNEVFRLEFNRSLRQALYDYLARMFKND